MRINSIGEDEVNPNVSNLESLSSDPNNVSLEYKQVIGELSKPSEKKYMINSNITEQETVKGEATNNKNIIDFHKYRSQ